MKDVYSSYRENNYNALFESLIRLYQPVNCVELGCLEGYSALGIAKGLKENGGGKLTIIDLFEDYEFNHCAFETVLNNFKTSNLDSYIELIKGDVFDAISSFTDASIDFIHIDISNNGDLLDRIFHIIEPKLTPNGIILFEGGSVERDNIEWMLKYGKKAINNFIQSDYFQRNFKYFVFSPYPSLTICEKK